MRLQLSGIRKEIPKGKPFEPSENTNAENKTSLKLMQLLVQLILNPNIASASDIFSKDVRALLKLGIYL